VFNQTSPSHVNHVHINLDPSIESDFDDDFPEWNPFNTDLTETITKTSPAIEAMSSTIKEIASVTHQKPLSKDDCYRELTHKVTKMEETQAFILEKLLYLETLVSFSRSPLSPSTVQPPSPLGT
jgi:hypothetical protein